MEVADVQRKHGRSVKKKMWTAD